MSSTTRKPAARRSGADSPATAPAPAATNGATTPPPADTAFERAEVLRLDDLGKEPATDRVQLELFGLLERRNAQLRPVIATTQLPPDELAERYAGHVADALIGRLREFCEPVQFPFTKATLGL